VSLPKKTKFDPQFAIADSSGKATQNFRDYMTAADALLTALASGTAPNNLVNAANDAAADAAGVPVRGLYLNGSVLMVRVI
jgi:hypothetical protein